MNVFQNLRNLFSVTPVPHATDPDLRRPQNGTYSTRVDSQHPSLVSRTARYFKTRSKRLLAKLQLIDATAESKEPELQQQAPIAAVHQRYVPIRLLGSGGNGEVHLSRDSGTGKMVAVKTVYHGKSYSPPVEVRVLRLLGHHNNIVQFRAVLEHPHRYGCWQLVFERYESGDLADLIDATSGMTPELCIWSAFKQINNGLHYIHSKQIIHGDLKPANILLRPARSGELHPTFKIADFGSAAVNPPSDIPRGHLGTLGWQPPEAIYRTGPETDIWSLGCILYELAARTLPFNRLQKPNVDAETWFDISGRSVPPGTLHKACYKRFCHFMAFHPAAPQRIDTGPLCPDSPVVYSKLLNYMMMCTLDIDYRTRITTGELQRYLPVLDTLAYTVTLSGREAMLNKFDDGRDKHWRHVNAVTDSSVFEQLFYAIILRARRVGSAEMMGWATPLLKIMEVDELHAARTFMEELHDAWAQ